MVFLGGVHGAGKSSLCNKIYERTGIPFYTASVLIRNYKKDSLTKSKLTKNIDDNQHILAKCVEQILDRKFILDGHLCLLDERKKICKIDRNIVQQLNPKSILIKTSIPDEIYRRLIERDCQVYDIDLITRFQNAEVNYAQEMANFLGIQMVEITDSYSLNQVCEIIKEC